MSPRNRVAARQSRRDGKRARQAQKNQKLVEHVGHEMTVAPKKRSNLVVKPLTQSQREYDAAFRANRIIYGTGPAGTGKTWLATMRAAEALESGEIEKIVITRPAVEAGESLGFLPGELEDKYEPYIRPVRDALEEKFGTGHLEYLLKKKVIEARPLGMLRGSTFKHCWVILDEAQNVTPTQMQMFLTRIGENCKMIINGDLKQKDIPGLSGMEHSMRVLSDVAAVEVVSFGVDDVVRDGICRDIVVAYDRLSRQAKQAEHFGTITMERRLQ